MIAKNDSTAPETPTLSASDGGSCYASFGTMQDAYLRIIAAPWKQATRGPNGCPIIGNANGTMVCMLAHSTNHSDQRAEAEANAGLIEAAPRMLKALQAIAGYDPNAMSGYECKEIAAEVLESIHHPNVRPLATGEHCSPSSGLRTISGNPSMLRNADVGHMLELREKIVPLEMERDALRKALQRLINNCVVSEWDHQPSRAVKVEHVVNPGSEAVANARVALLPDNVKEHAPPLAGSHAETGGEA